MSEPFSYDEFSALVSQIQSSSSIEEVSLSSESLQKLDSMTRYFYSKEKESKDDNDELKNTQKNLTIQTILDSSYQLMNYYRQNLQLLANSFAVSYSPNAKVIIKDISQTLQIDPTQNLTQQILKKNQNSQTNKTESDLFEMPDSAIDKQIKNDILKEHVAELEKLLRSERKEKSELSDKCNNLNIKIINLERKVDDYEQVIEVQKAKLEDQNELSAPQQEGIFSLQTTIHALSRELELQNQDLSDLSKQKENLIKINEKQSSFINLLMKEAEKVGKNETTETPSIDVDQIYSNDLFDRILEITATISSPAVDHVTDIIHDGYNKSDYEKVVEIVTVLIDDIRSRQDQINKLQVNGTNESDENTSNENNNNETNGMQSLLSMNLAQKVMNALRSEVAFIERLANSKSDRHWIKPTEETDDFFRNELQEEVEKAHMFLEENCKGIIEDSINEGDVFESLSLSGDPLQLKESLKKYLDSYPTLITEEGQALMNILRHSIAAVSILNRYGIEVKNTFQYQVNQIKSCKQTINELTKDNKELKETEEAAVQKYEDMQDIMLQAMNTLQSAYLQLANGNTVSFPTEVTDENDFENVEADNDDVYLSQSIALKAVLNAIEQIQQLEKVNADDYQQSVESKLVEALNDLDELRNSRMNEIEELENRSFSLRDQAEKDIQRQKLALEKQKVAFENASDEIRQLKSDIQILTDSLHESQKNYQELQERLNGSRISTREIPETSLVEPQVVLDSDNNSVNSVDLTSANNVVNPQDMKKEIRKIEKKFQRSLIAIHVQEKEKRKGIKQKLHKLRDENESLINQINEKDRQIKILETTQEQLLADHKNRSSRLRESEIQEQKNVSRLKAQVNELTMKLATTEMAKKVAEQQLKSLEEKALRRENDTKSIQEILKQEYSTRLEERANGIREECNNKHNDFVKQVVQEFRTCFDILPTIASSPNKISLSPNKGQFIIGADLNSTNAAALEEVAMKLVKTATESIKYYSAEKKKNKKQLKELQNLFSASSPIATEVTKAATSYVNNAKAQIESLQKQLLSKNKNIYSVLDASPVSTTLPATTPTKVMSIKDWENWARKLYMWSNKGQSLLLSIQSVMKSVEETILEASGNNNKVSKQNSILRAEKIIMMQNSDELLFPSNAGHTALMPTHLQSIADILFFVHRIQRLSGTLPSNLALNTNSSSALTSEFLNASPQPYSWNRKDETPEKESSPNDIDNAKKQQMDDYDFKEEQEIQQKLQQIQKQEDLANDEAEVAAIDLAVEEEEEPEEGHVPQPQPEHGEEQ